MSQAPILSINDGYGESSTTNTGTIQKVLSSLHINSNFLHAGDRSPSPSPLRATSPSPSLTRSFSNSSARDSSSRSSSPNTLSDADSVKEDLANEGWDIGAIERRAEEGKYKTTSVQQREEILTLYSQVVSNDANPEEKKKEKKERKEKKEACKKLLNTLMSIVTEHDELNFPKLIQLVKLNPGEQRFIPFIGALPGYGMKSVYKKTFILAAYVNTQDLTADEIKQMIDLMAGIQSSDLSDHARANVIYICSYLGHYEDLHTTRVRLTSKNFDPPKSKSLVKLPVVEAVPGLDQAIARFKSEPATVLTVKGFYDRHLKEKESETLTEEAPQVAIEKPLLEAALTEFPMTIEFGKKPPPELKTRLSRFGQRAKDLIPSFNSATPLYAVVSEEGHAEKVGSWEMDGGIDEEGHGLLEPLSEKVLFYDFHITPWGVAGQKVKGTRTSAGAFYLGWTDSDSTSSNSGT
ncbi:hypothetical protein M422DRAFT_249956 [Sphaerobolus stellatus SS14]|nr:hypothetical protein M422DRAFT_249956 [Sphaerobolus stellatus SS14]